MNGVSNASVPAIKLSAHGINIFGSWWALCQYSGFLSTPFLTGVGKILPSVYSVGVPNQRGGLMGNLTV